MKLKGRTILVLALLVFGGYAIYEYLHDKNIEVKTAEESRILTVNADQVDSIMIEKGSQHIALKRSVEGWSLEEPLKDLADNTAVEDFIKNINSEKIIEVANSGSEINWSMYGLDQPLGRVTLKTTSGAKNTFSISTKKNFEENTFARRDSELRVLVLNSVWQNRVNKNAIDFRDRRVLRHRIASVDFFRIKNKDAEFDLSLNENLWQSSGAKKISLDQNKVRDVLQSLVNAKAEEYVDTMPALKPLFTLELKLADKVWKMEVGQAQNLKIYANVSDSQLKMKLEPGSLDKFIKLRLEDLKQETTSHDNNEMTKDKKDKK